MLCFAAHCHCEGAEQMELKTPTGTIYGTLEMPEVAKPVPIVLIISGSGPTDRDGNSATAGRNDSLKMLAAGLAANGIASLRYDKRGIAASISAGTKEDDLRFEAYIDDAVLWGKLLRQDRRFMRLIIVGHSEGSLIGMVAAKKLAAEAFISIAGPGKPASEIIEEQLAKNAPPDLLFESRNIIEKLKKGETTEKVSPTLLALFRLSVQPYLISWFRYVPTHEISELTVAILIIQGSTDLQVSISDAKRLSQANKYARLIIIDGMNHILKKVPNDITEQMKSYSDPSLPIIPGLIDTVATFIQELNGKK
jgi:pimeloyl-ACP methyl ester carboxylesterase